MLVKSGRYCRKKIVSKSENLVFYKRRFFAWWQYWQLFWKKKLTRTLTLPGPSPCCTEPMLHLKKRVKICCRLGGEGGRTHTRARAHTHTHTHTGLGKVSRIYPNRPLQAMNGCVGINFFLVISAGKPAFHIDANQRTLAHVPYARHVICINKTQATCAVQKSVELDFGVSAWRTRTSLWAWSSFVSNFGGTLI